MSLDMFVLHHVDVLSLKNIILKPLGIVPQLQYFNAVRLISAIFAV
jgi:hypothetical protein